MFKLLPADTEKNTWFVFHDLLLCPRGKDRTSVLPRIISCLFTSTFLPTIILSKAPTHKLTSFDTIPLRFSLSSNKNFDNEIPNWSLFKEEKSTGAESLQAHNRKLHFHSRGEKHCASCILERIPLPLLSSTKDRVSSNDKTIHLLILFFSTVFQPCHIHVSNYVIRTPHTVTGFHQISLQRLSEASETGFDVFCLPWLQGPINLLFAL